MNKFAPRIGIYETNSSSSHSFSLGPRGRLGATIKEDPIFVYTDSWEPYEKFNSPELKLSYLLCFSYTLTTGYDEEESEEYKRIKDIIIDVVKEYTGAHEVNVITSQDCLIDHQSTDIIDFRDLDDREFIKEFVFNPKTWVYNVWDSFCPPDGFYEREDPVLYTLVFDLPGIDEPEEIDVTIDNLPDLSWLLSNALSKYVWAGQNFYRIKDGQYKNFAWYKKYSGDMKYGDYKVYPKVYFKKDDKS